MGVFFSLLGWRFLGWRLDTIARKPEHDKATGHLHEDRP
jgi:hypothetical protein